MTACPCCSVAADRSPFYTHPGVPVHSCVMVDTRKSALDFPTGDLELVHCPSCDFIWNRTFRSEAMAYSAGYEETQVFSPRFREFQSRLANQWHNRYGLDDKRIVEIGCGKGDFLLELCGLGANRGLGIDPVFDHSRHEARQLADTSFLQEFYQPHHTLEDCDFLCCRHTLEHIDQPLQFMQLIRDHAAQTNAVIAFDLPDTERILKEGAFWDVYYEHCSYFCFRSISQLFKRVGLDVLELYRDFDDQYLVIEACLADATLPPSPPQATDQSEMTEWIDEFQRMVERQQSEWRRLIQTKIAEQKRIVLWGSGSKAVAFLSRLQLSDEIASVVDINPHRHGKFLVGTGHEIISPQCLPEVQPDVVLIMNPIYYDEISRDLKSLNVAAELVTL